MEEDDEDSIWRIANQQNNSGPVAEGRCCPMSSQARSVECLLQAGPWAVSSLGEAVNLALERSFTCAWLPGPPGVY